MLAQHLAQEFSFTKNTTEADVAYFAKNNAKYYFSPLRCKVLVKYARHIAQQIKQVYIDAEEHNAEMQIAWATW